MRSTLLFGFVLALASAGASAQGTMQSAAAPMRSKAPAGAEVYIISPRDGATIGPDATVRFGLKGMGVAPAGIVKAGTGHHHLLIDVKELPPLDQPIPNDEHHRHYGGGQTEAAIHLAPGMHTLQLDLGDAAHMQFDPPIVSKRITVHVR